MRTAPLLLVLALLLVACGTEDPAAPSTGGGGAGGGGDPVLVIADGEPTGPGMSVADALGHGPTDDLVTVTGALFVGICSK